MTPEEGLAFLSEQKFRKSNYIAMKAEVHSIRTNIFPVYKHVINADVSCGLPKDNMVGIETADSLTSSFAQPYCEKD